MSTIAGVSAGKPGEATAAGEQLVSPVRDGAFAKELTKLASPRQAPAALASSVVKSGRASHATSTLVEATRTRLSGQEAAQALSTAWQKRFGSAPPAGALEILVADWAHETSGGRAMMNYNFGGLKGTGPSGLTSSYLTTEGTGTAEQKLVDHFRAYRTADEGASDYIGVLAERYPHALQAARQGDAPGFVRALQEKGYFTGSEEAYTRSVTQLANRARALGFDALGPKNESSSELAASAAHLQATVASSSPLTAPATSPPLAPVASADALAMADELSRAALRIAASGSKRRDEEA